MARPRVHEVAKELGLTSKEVLAHLEKIGHPAKSHSSAIDEAIADRLRTDLGNGAAPAATEAPAPAPKKAAANPKPAPAPAKPKAASAPPKTKPAAAPEETAPPKAAEPAPQDP